MALKFNNPLNFQLRNGTMDDPFIPCENSRVIINNQIVLDEIPDSLQHVIISGYTEVYKIADLTATNFLVNYTNSIVTFAPSEEGKTVTASYYGRGVILFPAERIYTNLDENNNVTQTFQELVDIVKSQKSILKNPVGTFSDIAITYPSPELNWTVRTIDDGKLYKYDGINTWLWFDTLSLTAYDVLVKRLIVNSVAPSFPNIGDCWIDTSI